MKVLNIDDLKVYMKKEFPDFKAGDVLQLNFDHGIPASNGQKAIVTDKEVFPKYYRELCDKVGKDVVENEFVAVTWVSQNSRLVDGFYHKARFFLTSGVQA